MKRSVVRADRTDPDALKRAVRKLVKGQVVALPAAGRYVLVTHAEDPDARAALALRLGPASASTRVRLLTGFAAVESLAGGWPRSARRLAGGLWPGPLVLALEGRDGAPDERFTMPAEPWLKALAAESALPLAVSRAARPDEPAPLNAAGVLAALDLPPDLILDAGRQPGGPGWSEVRCTREHFTVVEPGSVPRARLIRAAAPLLLVVCTGNICRSPLAEALLRLELANRLGCRPDQLVRYGFRIASCGTGARDGLPASDHAQRTGTEHDVDLSHHRSRSLRAPWVREARRIYALAPHHVDSLIIHAPERAERIELLDPDGETIDDPYGRSLSVYRRVADRIARACARRAEELLAGERGPDPEGPAG